MSGNNGSVLFETLLAVLLLLGALFWTQVAVIRLCASDNDRLQKQRLTYDGNRP